MSLELPDDTLHSLTRRIAAGDAASFSAFYEHCFDWTYALVRSTTGRDESFCLDIVQDTMLRVAARMKTMSTCGDLERWLTRVVRSAAADRLRSDRRRAQREAGASRDRACADSVDLLRDLTTTEREHWVAARIEELPVVEQRLLQARFRDGKTLAATGKTVGLSGHAAHGRIRRTLHRLRALAREAFANDD